MKRFWTLLPIIAAALAVLWMVIIASRSPLELARETWDAREFTGYHAVIRYYDGLQSCTHDIVVEAEEIITAQQTGDCNLPIEDVEYPTITDLMNYLVDEEV